MFSLKWFKFFIFFYIIQTIIARHANKITRKNVDRLIEKYPNIMYLSIQDHLFYANEISGGKNVLCPIPWNRHKYHSEDLYYGDIKVSGNNLFKIVDSCLNKEKYALAYAIILNVIESVGVTYIYRFCRYARELNKRGGNLTSSKTNFNGLLQNITAIFKEEMISTQPINCIKVVFDKYDAIHEDGGYKKPDIEYRSDLLKCIQFMENKIDFVNLGIYVIPENEISLMEMANSQNNNLLQAFKLLFKNDVEVKPVQAKLDNLEYISLY